MRHERDELLNVLTHGFGVVASIAAAAILIVLASLRGSAAEIVGVSVFGATLIMLYVASTLYHAARSDVARARLKVFDHAAIFFLIAGSYTPFMIGSLGGGWGWSLFGVVWGLALVGAVIKIFAAGRFRLLSTFFYIAMGWLIVIAAGPLVRQLDAATLGWLLAGGIAYTAGTPFYHTSRFRHSHAVWHLFVLAGSACHAIAVGIQI